MIDNEIIKKLGYNFKQPDTIIQDLIKDMNVSNLIKTIISNRLKITDIKKYNTDINSYIFNHLNFNKDIDKLKDVYKAADVIITYIKNGGHICLATDYDADGVDSAAVLYLIFKNIFNVPKDKLSVIVNKRKNGNGFNKILMDSILDLNSKHKIDLLIAADHGSTNNKEYKILKENNITTVITDHHQINYENYPEYADVFVNTQREDSDYFKDVSGCFVAFLTCVATYNKLHKTEDHSVFYPILPYVALTTITDVMSLKLPINREIVKAGVNEMNSGRNPLWLITKTILGIPGKIVPKHLGYNIGPLINTANRLDIEESAFELLVSETKEEVITNAKNLLQHNNFRKTVQNTLVNKAKLDDDLLFYKHSIVYVIETDFAVGGIVAANLGDTYKLPCVCFLSREDEETLTGSCRGIIKGLDVVDVLRKINNKDDSIFVKRDGIHLFGGHDGAAGCSIYKNKLEIFRQLFDAECSEYIDHIKKDKVIKIDSEIPDKKLLPSLVKELEACAPYGKDWEEPVFITKLKVSKILVLGSFSLMFFKTSDYRTIKAKCFFKSQSDLSITNIKNRFKENEEVYVVYNVSLDTFSNSINFVLDVIDIKKVGD